MSKTNLLKKNYGLYINGEWTKCSEGETMTVTNPANGEDLSTIINRTKEDSPRSRKSPQIMEKYH